MDSMMRGGQAASHQAHILENAGSNPAPATIMVLMLAVAGCGVSLRMHGADVIGRRVKRVEEAVKTLKAATDVPEVKPGEPEPEPPTVDAKSINDLAESVLYECQELLGWIKSMRKDVGEVPKKKKLKLDTPAERDTQFEYIVESGARASKRDRHKEQRRSLPRLLIEWTVGAVWRVLPWWIKLPLLAALMAWGCGTVYIYYMRVRATRAASQGEAVISRLQKHVGAEQFIEAVDVERNLDLAKVHEKQKKRARKIAARKA